MAKSNTSENKIGEGLDEKLVDPNPVNQFQRWLDEAIAAHIPLPEAMTLATATAEGKPSARLVLLKRVDENGFVFFTNYQSAKARDLDNNPFAALVFYWPHFERQVRVEGQVQRTSDAESREYFQTRPRESQIGALASPQSEVISGREVLEQRAASYGISVQEYKTNNILRTEITSRDVGEIIAELCGPYFSKTTGAQVPIDGGNERVI